MASERRNQTAKVDRTELLLRVWEEQVIAARHSIMDARKRQRERAVFQVQGVHFMLLTLRDYLIGLRDFNAKEKIEKQYAFVVELIDEQWKGAL